MTDTWGFGLTEIDLPRFDTPRDQPRVPATTYAARLEATYAAMAERGLDALVVYGDREHFATIQYLTGFDPRYEECLLVFVPGRTPTFLVGNEMVAYAGVTPYPVEIVRQSKFSLVGQPDPDDLALADQLRAAGLADPGVARIGIAGWKYFSGAGTDGWFDVPHFVVTSIAEFGEPVVATQLFVEPGRGLRLSNDVDQIAYFEFAATHGSQAMIRLLHGVRAGMTELEASGLMSPIMLPLNYHPTMLSGPNASLGVASPSGRVMRTGDAVGAGIGYWGSNIARAGFLIESADQLPEGAQDYLEKIVVPYYATAAAWYETIRIGLTAGELYDVTASRIGDPFYGIFLNPGHYIHLDEWPSSPVAAGSPVVFESGNAIQLDIIPMPKPPYMTSQIEDGIVLADTALRESLAEAYPDAWHRIQGRRAMLSSVFGIDLHEEVLPMSDTAGYLPPYWAAPHLALARR